MFSNNTAYRNISDGATDGEQGGVKASRFLKQKEAMEKNVQDTIAVIFFTNPKDWLSRPRVRKVNVDFGNMLATQYVLRILAFQFQFTRESQATSVDVEPRLIPDERTAPDPFLKCRHCNESPVPVKVLCGSCGKEEPFELIQ